MEIQLDQKLPNLWVILDELLHVAVALLVNGALFHEGSGPEGLKHFLHNFQRMLVVNVAREEKEIKHELVEISFLLVCGVFGVVDLQVVLSGGEG